MLLKLVLPLVLATICAGVHNFGHKPWPKDVPKPSLIKGVRKADPPPEELIISQHFYCSTIKIIASFCDLQHVREYKCIVRDIIALGSR